MDFEIDIIGKFLRFNPVQNTKLSLCYLTNGAQKLNIKYKAQLILIKKLTVFSFVEI